MDQSQSFPIVSFYAFHPQILETKALPPINFERLNEILEQNSKFIEENKALTQRIKELCQENKRIKSLYIQLKRQQQTQFRLEKRKYTPRRMELEKSFLCDIENCCKSYSSIIALRNHQRAMHNLLRREKKCQP